MLNKLKDMKSFVLYAVCICNGNETDSQDRRASSEFQLYPSSYWTVWSLIMLLTYPLTADWPSFYIKRGFFLCEIRRVWENIVISFIILKNLRDKFI